MPFEFGINSTASFYMFWVMYVGGETAWLVCFPDPQDSRLVMKGASVGYNLPARGIVFMLLADHAYSLLLFKGKTA